VKTLAISPAIASEAAHLRASQGYKTPDAIQLATAQNGHARFFVTNDEALANAPGLQVVVLKHLFARP
jgi:predicted nucleic acid-binding protein